ncbi:MAG TPA: hypothetical protein VMZ53_20035 [Kofleriaceae bacterium]|nr:hypothetical protein [Kofleriaceae bacterium]
MRFVAALVVVLAVAGSSVHADPAADAKAKVAADAGAALFGKNDFAGAAKKFREAYDLNHDASYLFNIAQAYRHAGDCIRSADYYGRFLAVVPHPPNEDKIRVWYASELQCAKERAATVPVDDKQTHDATNRDATNGDRNATNHDATNGDRNATNGDANHDATNGDRKATHGGANHGGTNGDAATQQSSDASSGGGHRGLALALGGVGVVALGVGGFFAWDASYLSDRRASFLAGCGTTDRCSSAVVNDYDRRGSRAQTLAIVGFAAGGVAIAASATLYLMAGRSEAPPAVAITHVEGGAIVTRAFAW